MDAFTFLKSYVPIFAGVTDEALTELAVASSLRQLTAGQLVLMAGMTVDGVYIVATGTVTVNVKTPGKGSVKVAELKQTEVFGEASIIASSTAGATVKAGEAGAVLLFIPEASFRSLVVADTAFAERVRALIASRAAPPPAPRQG